MEERTCCLELEDDNKIFSFILEGMSNQWVPMIITNSEGTGDDHVVLEVRTDFLAHPPKRFQGACINSGAQLTIIGELQAKVYCKEYGGTISKSLSDHKYKFGK